MTNSTNCPLEYDSNNKVTRNLGKKKSYRKVHFFLPKKTQTKEKQAALKTLQGSLGPSPMIPVPNQSRRLSYLQNIYSMFPKQSNRRAAQYKSKDINFLRKALITDQKAQNWYKKFNKRLSKSLSLKRYIYRQKFHSSKTG